MVSILGKWNYNFPKQIPLTKTMKDYLEDEVDKKFYIDNEKAEKLIKQLIDSKQLKDNEILTEKTESGVIFSAGESGKGTDFRSRYAVSPDGIFPTLLSRDYKDAIRVTVTEQKKIMQIGMLDIKGNEQIRRVYSTNGIAPTLNTCGGGQREPKVIVEDFYKNREPRVYDETAPTIRAEREGLKVIEEKIIIGSLQKNAAIKTDGICTTLTEAMGKGGGQTPMIVASRGRNPDNPSDRKQGIELEQRLEPNLEWICNTLTSVQKDNLVLETNYRIRKLTPKECWRLMAFTDEDFHKAEQVNSNTQLYKQAGNSIVVKVLESIFKQMLKEE